MFDFKRHYAFMDELDEGPAEYAALYLDWLHIRLAELRAKQRPYAERHVQWLADEVEDGLLRRAGYKRTRKEKSID